MNALGAILIDSHSSDAALSALAIILGSIGAWVSAYFGSYMSERARNLAIKSDIADITRNVEAVRSMYTTALEQLKGRYQLRMACIDRRLQAQQDAFTHWRTLVRSAHDEKTSHAAVRAAEKWWENNCLFLDPDSRAAFRSAFVAADQLPALLAAAPLSQNGLTDWKKTLGELKSAGAIIVRGADLPPIGDEAFELRSRGDEVRK